MGQVACAAALSRDTILVFTAILFGKENTLVPNTFRRDTQQHRKKGGSSREKQENPGDPW